jgi:HSP20 family protein
MDIKRLNPWNWLKHEDAGTAVAVRTTEATPYSPWLSLHQQIDRLFDEAFRGFGLPALPSLETGESAVLRPSVDIDANDAEYRVSMDLPGVEEKDLAIEVRPDATLRIAGEKRHEREEKERNSYRTERSYGRFERILALPEDADDAAIKASYRNGVLTVTLPRKAEARANVRRIAINSDERPALKKAA